MKSEKTRGELRIRPFRSDSVEQAVGIHLAAFPGFFLARLGPRVLRILYREFAERPEDVVAIEARLNDKVVGVAVGPCRPGEFFETFVRRRRMSLAMASILFMLRTPASIPRILRAIRYRGEVKSGRGALLSSIAVDPEMQGTGVGRALLEAWCRGVRERGIEAAYLTTDRHENEATVIFYRRLGWEPGGTFVTREGRDMLTMTWDAASNIAPE
ncbi:MAG: hypothetical protein CMJ34_13250 [Phycisphaerae bacterium]|nr:hypothetical protein [Phycisphaerae bacterium]